MKYYNIGKIQNEYGSSFCDVIFSGSLEHAVQKANTHTASGYCNAQFCANENGPYEVSSKDVRSIQNDNTRSVWQQVEFI